MNTTVHKSEQDSISEFRQCVREFLAQALPSWLADKVRRHQTLSKQDHELWHHALNERGWLAPNWPKQFGGAQWGPLERYVFEEECALAYAPRVVPFGIAMLGPVLQKFGSPVQQDYWLPRILSGEDWWCQGYSEPGAGSDLAALSTRAERDGQYYRVNGQKTWTTLGQHANMIFALVRTNREVKKQEGISFLLIDMQTPGVEVRPIKLIDGSAEVNEIFFTDVKVPVENRVGEENQGWTYAKYLLTHERTNIAGVGLSRAGLETVKRLAYKAQHKGRPLAENPLFAARIARVEIDLMAMAATNLRMVSKAAEGQPPGVESSLLKIKGTQIRQEITDLARRVAGPHALPLGPVKDELEEWSDPLDAGQVAGAYFNHRKLSIFGGSNEIQREVYAKHGMRVKV